MSHIFPIPEIEGSAYCSVKTGGIFLGGHVTNHVSRPVHTMQITYHPKDLEFTWDVVFAGGSMPSCSFRLPIRKSVGFEAWLLSFGFRLTVGAERKVPAPAPGPVPSTCPVCFGTGFYKGFGAPCSKGCSS
jgi:hypothetical protein